MAKHCRWQNIDHRHAYQAGKWGRHLVSSFPPSPLGGRSTSRTPGLGTDKNVWPTKDTNACPTKSGLFIGLERGGSVDIIGIALPGGSVSWPRPTSLLLTTSCCLER